VQLELIDPAIAKCKGRIIKTMGDGMLIEFQSVTEALRRCAWVVYAKRPFAGPPERFEPATSSASDNCSPRPRPRPSARATRRTARPKDPRPRVNVRIAAAG
jgi:class 3 adenylate cyclase